MTPPDKRAVPSISAASLSSRRCAACDLGRYGYLSGRSLKAERIPLLEIKSPGDGSRKGLLMGLSTPAEIGYEKLKARDPMHSPLRLTLLLTVLLAVVPSWMVGPPAEARELWASKAGTMSFSLASSLKGTTVLAWAPDDPLLYPEARGGASLWRLRLTPSVTLDWLNVTASYEQRSRVSSVSFPTGLGSGGSIASSAPAFYRLTPLSETIFEVPPSFSYEHELDWAFASARAGRLELTLGRQPIGWGKSLLFAVTDIFAPLSPLEIDREWRRGVDAARARVQLSNALGLDGVVAWGESWEESIAAGRIQGYVGRLDAEVILGKRATDLMVASSMSAAVGDVAVHGEIGFFHTPDAASEAFSFEWDRVVTKAVLGASYQVPVGNGIRLGGEYHYCGFGIADLEDTPEALSDVDLQRRLERGDLQLLSRHTVLLTAGYDFNSVSSLNLLVLQSPIDGSGLVAPSLTWFFSDDVSLILTAFLPHGAPPEAGVLQSEYGAVPASVFVQAQLYH